MRNAPRRASGFTLIEMLVYLALFAILMTGTLLTIQRLLGDVTGVRAKVNTDEEANFLLRKISWALTGASVSNPAAGSSGNSLTLAKAGFGSNPIVFNLGGSAMQVSYAGGAA